jgi:hypothetical protein
MEGESLPGVDIKEDRYTGKNRIIWKNKEIAKHTVEVYKNDGTRRNKSEIANDVINFLK